MEAIVWNMHHNQVKWARFLRCRSELAADVHLPCEALFHLATSWRLACRNVSSSRWQTVSVLLVVNGDEI